MDENNTQVNNEELTAEEAKASLGISTRLTEQMLMSQVQQQAMEAPQEPQEAPSEDLELETEETPPIDPEALKEEISTDLKKEMKSIIRSELKKLLDEDDEKQDSENAE